MVWWTSWFSYLQVAFGDFSDSTRIFKLDPCSDCCGTILRSNSTSNNFTCISTFKENNLLLWVWAIASSTNVLVNGEVVKTKDYYYCDFSSDWIISHVILAAVNIALPLFIVAVLYTIVCHKLWSREVPGEGPNQNQGQAEAINIARKVTRMMIAIVVLYVLCWFPFDIIYALNFVIFVEISPELHTFLIWLTICYSGINPYIYITFSQKFRSQFRYIFRNFFRRIKIHNVLRYRSQSVDLEQL